MGLRLLTLTITLLPLEIHNQLRIKQQKCDNVDPVDGRKREGFKVFNLFITRCVFNKHV